MKNLGARECFYDQKYVFHITSLIMTVCPSQDLILILFPRREYYVRARKSKVIETAQIVAKAMYYTFFEELKINKLCTKRILIYVPSSVAILQ